MSEAGLRFCHPEAKSIGFVCAAPVQHLQTCPPLSAISFLLSPSPFGEGRGDEAVKKGCRELITIENFGIRAITEGIVLIRY